MKNKIRVFTSYILFITCIPFVSFSQNKLSSKNSNSPNVILILADDQGWGATSVLIDKNIKDSKSDFIRMPNLEKLASQSVIYSNGYAAHPNCSPTRASILTGKSPAKLHLTDIIERHDGPLYKGNKLIPPSHIDGLPSNEITIAEVIRSSRPEYALAHFGKWHLGNGGPEKHGFDESDGQTSNGAGNRRIPGNPKDIFGVTNRATKWMDKQVKANKPFYLQISHYATHSAPESKGETIDKVKSRTPGKRHNDIRWTGMSEDLDDGLGILINEVERLGIADNTYIIYLADNGGQPTQNPGNMNGPLHGWKATIWEGGIRVPFLVAGPGIKHAYSRTSVTSLDLYPTICDWLNIKNLPTELEGGSLVNSLKKPADKNAVKRENDFLVFHFPHYQLEKGGQPATAIIKNDYKLIKFYEDNFFYLFNLKDDISETVNLAKSKPEIVKELTTQLDAYLKKINAGLPTINSQYNEAKDPGRKNRAVKKRLMAEPYFVL